MERIEQIWFSQIVKKVGNNNNILPKWFAQFSINQPYTLKKADQQILKLNKLQKQPTLVQLLKPILSAEQFESVLTLLTNKIPVTDSFVAIYKTMASSNNHTFIVKLWAIEQKYLLLALIPKTWLFNEWREFEEAEKQEGDNEVGHLIKKLSDTELVVLKLLARGKKRADISSELNISVNTYDKHRYAITKKLSKQEYVNLVNWHNSSVS